MSSRVQQLSRAFRSLQKMDPAAIEVALLEECIDKWEVKYHYPDNKLVHLNYEFHLVENLVINPFPLISCAYACSRPKLLSSSLLRSPTCASKSSVRIPAFPLSSTNPRREEHLEHGYRSVNHRLCNSNRNVHSW